MLLLKLIVTKRARVGCTQYVGMIWSSLVSTQNCPRGLTLFSTRADFGARVQPKPKSCTALSRESYVRTMEMGIPEMGTVRSVNESVKYPTFMLRVTGTESEVEAEPEAAVAVRHTP